MKTIILTIALAISTFFLKAQTNDVASIKGATITVTVPVASNEGNVIFGLYDENTFMKAAPIQGLEGEIIDGKATVIFTNVVPGTYGITLFHDKNGNKQMDFEPNGMPKEMYGVSNNVMNYGPPQWNDAKFEVSSESLAMEIRL
jgi:uncharacterized protein (DUF2141 family)